MAHQFLHNIILQHWQVNSRLLTCYSWRAQFNDTQWASTTIKAKTSQLAHLGTIQYYLCLLWMSSSPQSSLPVIKQTLTLLLATICTNTRTSTTAVPQNIMDTGIEFNADGHCPICRISPFEVALSFGTVWHFSPTSRMRKQATLRNSLGHVSWTSMTSILLGTLMISSCQQKTLNQSCTHQSILAHRLRYQPYEPNNFLHQLEPLLHPSSPVNRFFFISHKIGVSSDISE